MNKIIQHMLAGADNQTTDLGRVLWALSFMVALGIEAYSVATGRPFDIQAHGIGVCALLASGGAALALKAKTEP
jgi:hypothetical protein